MLCNPVDTGRKLNVHKTFRRCPGRLVNILFIQSKYMNTNGFSSLCQILVIGYLLSVLLACADSLLVCANQTEIKKNSGLKKNNQYYDFNLCH